MPWCNSPDRVDIIVALLHQEFRSSYSFKNMYFLDDNLSGERRILYGSAEVRNSSSNVSTLVEKFRNSKRPVIFYLLYKHHEIHRGYCMAARIYETIATMIFSREITSYLHA